MNDNTISSNLTRIKDATDDIRSTLGTPGAAIEDVASDVATLSTQYNQMASDYNDLIIENNRLRQQIVDLTPKGTINITQNGEVNVSQYAYARVSVGSQQHQDIYKASSLNELNSLQNVEVGDLGVVTDMQTEPLTNSFTTGLLVPEAEVIFDEPIQDWEMMRLDGENYGFEIRLQPGGATISYNNWNDNVDIQLEYSTEDDQHYVLVDTPKNIEIKEMANYIDFNELSAQLIRVGNPIFGIYEYQPRNTYNFTTIGGTKYSYIPKKATEGVPSLSGGVFFYNIQPTDDNITFTTIRANNCTFYIQDNNLYCYNPNNYRVLVFRYDNPTDFEISSGGVEWYSIPKNQTQLIMSNITLNDMAFVNTVSQNQYVYDSPTGGNIVVTTSKLTLGNSGYWNYYYIGADAVSNTILSGYRAYTDQGMINGNCGIVQSLEEVGPSGIYTDLCNNVSQYVWPMDCTELYWGYQGADLPILKIMDLSPIKRIYGMFGDCANLTSLNLKDIEITCSEYYYDEATGKNVYGSVGSCFSGCTSLEFLDIRGITFSSCTQPNDEAIYSCLGADYYEENRVPANCLIIVKDDTERNWLLNYYNNWFTNIKTVEEYEGGNE